MSGHSRLTFLRKAGLNQQPHYELWHTAQYRNQLKGKKLVAVHSSGF
jgi:hypothetical protein